MPAGEKRMSEEERWNLVNYVRIVERTRNKLGSLGHYSVSKFAAWGLTCPASLLPLCVRYALSFTPGQSSSHENDKLKHI